MPEVCVFNAVYTALQEKAKVKGLTPDELAAQIVLERSTSRR